MLRKTFGKNKRPWRDSNPQPYRANGLLYPIELQGRL